MNDESRLTVTSGAETQISGARGEQSRADTDSFPSPREALYGRSGELEVLDAFVARLQASRGGMLVLRGEAGVGKTVLLDAVADAAAAQGVAVVRASGVEFEADISYASLHQLLYPFLGVLEELPTWQRRAISVALELSAETGPGHLMLTNAVLSLLARAAQDAPVLLVVDDLPWLDRSSAKVLGIVARRLSGTRVGLIGAARSGEDTVFDTGGSSTVTVRPLEPLPAAFLLGDRYPALSPRAKQRLLKEAAGNPLALLELPVLLGDDGPGPLVVPGPLPLGERLGEAFGARLRGVSGEVQNFLLLAVLDGTGELGFLRSLDSTRDVDHVLATATRYGLVDPDFSRERLRFRHPLIRSAVVALATVEQRRRAHTRARLASRR